MRAKKSDLTQLTLFVQQTLKMNKNIDICTVKNAIQTITEPHECCLLLPLKMSQIFKEKKAATPANCGWCQGY